MSPSEAVLELEGVSKSYEDGAAKGLRRRRPRVPVLKDISFQVGQGETVGVLGRNGAGKSTLLKLISRVTAPDSGRVSVRGRVGSLLEVGTGFHPELTGWENVNLSASLLGMKPAEVGRVRDKIVEFADLAHAMDRPLKHYSSGMQVRLGFSVAAHLRCDVMLMDEVLAVGDALFQARCLRKLSELCTEEGRTALVVSHAMAPVARLCSRALVFADGRVDFDGDTAGGIAHYIRSLQGSFPEHGTLVDLSKRHNPYGADLWVQSVESVVGSSDESVREYLVRVHLARTTSRPLVLGFGVSDNVGVGVTAGFLELPVVTAAMVGRTVAARLSIPVGSVSPGVYFLDLGISEGLGSPVADQVRRAVAINADAEQPEDWRLKYGDAVIVLPVETSWDFE